jgi:hypothetical protein
MFVLVTEDGFQMYFHLRACAEIYRGAFGGMIKEVHE